MGVGKWDLPARLLSPPGREQKGKSVHSDRAKSGEQRHPTGNQCLPIRAMTGAVKHFPFTYPLKLQALGKFSSFTYI